MSKRKDEPVWDHTITAEHALKFVRNVVGEDEEGFYARYKRPDLLELVPMDAKIIYLTPNELAGIVHCARMNFKVM